AEAVRKVDRRVLAFAGAVLFGAVIGRVFVSHPVKAVPPAVHHATAMESPIPYAMEKPAARVPLAELAKPAPQLQSAARAAQPQPAASPVSESSPAVQAIEPKPAPVSSPSGTNAVIQLTTTPAGATYSVYPGVIANKTAPSTEPFRTGSTPGAIEDLPPGRYT